MFMLRLVLISFFIFCSILFSQDLKIKKYSFRDGLPNSEITGIDQDSLGYIWCSSTVGIIRYDGIEWKLMNDAMGIPKIVYSRIYIDKQNTIWSFSSEDDRILIKYDGETAQIINFDSLKVMLDNEVIVAFKVRYVDNVPELYIQTSANNIYKYEKKKWDVISYPDLFDKLYSMEFFNSKLILSTNKGLFEYSNRELKKFIFSSGELNDRIDFLKTIKYEGDEQLYLMSDKKLFRYESGNLQLLTSKLKLRFTSSYYLNYYLESTQNGNLFLGNAGGFYCLSKEQKILEEYLDIEELQHAGGVSLLIDKEDIIWLATGRGIYKIIQSPFTTIKDNEEISYNEVASLHITKKTGIVIGQYGKISLYKNSKAETFIFPGDPFINKTTARVMDIKSDEDDNIWFVVNPFGFGKISDGKLNFIKLNQRIESSALHIMKNGTKLIGGTEGIFEINGNDLVKLDKDIKFVRRIKQFDEDEVIVCTGSSGIYFLNKEGNKNYKTSNAYLNSTYDILKIDENKYWVATRGGILELNTLADSYKKIYSSEITNQVYSINYDSEKSIWLGTDYGFVKLINDKIHRYTASIGLSGNEANRAAFVEDYNNNIWLGTDKGLSIYNREQNNLKISHPNCLIQEVFIDGILVNYIEEGIVLPGNSKMEIKYRGLTYTEEELIKYRIKLYDEDAKLVFEKITDRNEIELFALQPGEYSLLIWAITPLSVESINPAKLKVFVDENFFQTNWFYLILIVLSSSITYVIYYIIAQNKYSKTLEYQIEKKTSELMTEIGNKNLISERLLKSEEKYRGLFDHSVMGIFQISLNGDFRMTNASFKSLLGYNVEENIPETKNFINISEDEDDAKNFIDNIIQSKLIIGEKLKIKTIDNTVIKVRCNAKIIDEDIEDLYIEGTFEELKH